MKFLGFNINRNNNKQETRSFETLIGSVNYSTYSTYITDKALTLSAVNRACNLLSDGIASLNLKTYLIDNEGFKTEFRQSNLYNLLTIEPNSKMGKYTMFKNLITSVLLTGNGYILINRDKKGNVLSLDLIDSSLVSIELLGNEIKYKITGYNTLIDSSNMIHIINYPSANGLYGISTIEHASNVLKICYDTQQHSQGFLRNGASMSGFLTTNASLKPETKEQIKKEFSSTVNPEFGTPNGITILSNGEFKFQPITINPKDAQMLENQVFNVIEVARFFNVNPALLFDSSNSQSGTIENIQLSFLNTSLLPIIEKLENEFTRKLLKPSERQSIELRFDLSNLLRLDSASKASFYSQMFNLGVFSTNDICRLENLPKVNGEGANKHFTQVNLQPLENLFADQKNNNQLDNNLK